MLKIAYISIIPSYSVGIFKKIKEKALISNKCNLNMDYYLINPIEDYFYQNIYFIKKDYQYIPSKFLKKIIFRLFKFKDIDKIINFNSYDAIVLRYPLVDGFWDISFFERFGHKIFTEHHTDEISELKANNRLADKVRVFIEKKYSAKALANVRGIIGVTDEIRKIQLKKLGKQLPSITIANGINISDYKQTGFKNFDGKILRMIFVASTFYSWHGLDKLLNSISKYKGHIEIELHLIGNLNRDQQRMIKNIIKNNKKVIIHGSLDGDKLDLLFSEMNLAISSLALSRNNMSEACPIKSREYIVRGIPFIYSYKDPDLKGNELFAKKLKEDSIIIEDIIEFVNSVSQNRLDVENQMNQYKNIISLENKLTILKDFIEINLQRK